MPTVLFISVLLIVAFLAVFLRWPRRPYPPGPKPLPIVGNIFDLPTKHQWLTFDKWAKIYGDIVHVSVLGHHIVVLNSLDAVNDLLEKRSSIYSDRPRMPMIKELMGWDWGSVTMNYTPQWRKYRKAFQQYFNSSAIEAYRPMQELEAHRLLGRILDSPNDFIHHIKHNAAATILRVVYGLDVRHSDDKYISIAKAALEGGEEAAIPGSFLVDVIPALKYVPPWFPGAGFKVKARRWRAAMQQLLHVPFEDVKSAMSEGNAAPSVVASMLEHSGNAANQAEEETIIRSNAAVAYSGGFDTSHSVMTTFVLGMLLFPEVQKKAQQQLDDVVGIDRLPTSQDLASLPYILAIVKETLRWQPATPLGMAHCLAEADEYKGYYLPKGSIVMGNTWSILHDEKLFSDPFTFRPERFLKDGELDPSAIDPDIAAFGYGRRKCPGRHLAINSASIAIASILACFHIGPALDANGRPISVEPRMSPGFFSYPEAFPCSIRPRTDSVAVLIRAASAEA